LMRKRLEIRSIETIKYNIRRTLKSTDQKEPQISAGRGIETEKGHREEIYIPFTGISYRDPAIIEPLTRIFFNFTTQSSI
jgi:hypothetical protein